MTHLTARRLSADEEVRLVRAYADTQDPRARDALVAASMPLVEAFARRAWRRAPRLDLADLVQEGVTGFLQGLRRFDPGRGLRLSTYTTWWVKLALRTYVVQNARITQMPKTNATNRLVARLRATRARREAAGLPADPEALAQQLGVPASMIVEFDVWLSGHECSLQQPPGPHGDVPLGDFLPASTDVGADVEAHELAEKITAEAAAFYESLATDTERVVFAARVAATDLPTQESLGRAVGCTKQHISAVEIDLRRRFRDHLQGLGLAPEP